MKINLYLIFPYKGAGGVSVLFKRVAEWFADKNYNVKVIDFQDGFMSKNINHHKIEKIDFTLSKIKIPKNSICLMQLMTPWSMYKNLEFHEETRFFFWNCHPNNLIPSIPIFYNFFENHITYKKFVINLFFLKYKKKSITFLNLLLKNQSIVFMDDVNIKNTEFFLDLKINKAEKLPIPVPINKRTKEINKKFQKNLNVSWLGRVEDFKTKSLEKVISDLEDYRAVHDLKIIMNIIGQGKDLEKIKSHSRNSNLEFKFIDYLNTQDLHSFLSKNTDILFAMGTSSLEGGVCSIPTIILDICFKNLNSDYKYKWLFESKGFNLAELLHHNYSGSGIHNIETVIEETIANKKKIGDLCRSYVENNHNSDLIFSNLHSYINKTSLNWKNLASSNVTKAGLAYSIRKYFKN